MFATLRAALVATTLLAPASVAVAQTVPESSDPIRIVLNDLTGPFSELADEQVDRRARLKPQLGSPGFGKKTTHIVDALGNDQAELPQTGTDRVGGLVN